MIRTSSSSLATAAIGEVLDEIVEAALPPERAGDDVRRQGAVAVVGQLRAGLNQGGREVDTLGGHRTERAKRRRTGRRNHRPLARRSRLIRRRPARNSPASSAGVPRPGVR